MKKKILRLIPLLLWIISAPLIIIYELTGHSVFGVLGVIGIILCAASGIFFKKRHGTEVNSEMEPSDDP